MFLPYSSSQRKLILAAKLAGFDHIEVSSKRSIQKIPNIDLVHESYEKAIESTICTIVYVSMVNSDHGKWVRKVLESGKHCIVDKPSFINVVEAAPHRHGAVVNRGWFPSINTNINGNANAI